MKRLSAKGFTMFYALLVASLALAIGTAIFDITVREIELSSQVTQSQFAVYMADTGAECALYWDNKYTNAATNNNGGSNSAFATSSSDLTQNAQPSAGITCNTADITTSSNWNIATVGAAATTTFMVAFPAYGRCAVVTVAKTGNPSLTTIISSGFNTCTVGGIQIERVLQVSY